jgi:hypothetical protein
MKKIGELLVENGVITQADLDKALDHQKALNTTKPVGEILVEMKVITIDSLLKYLGIQLKNKFDKM